MSRLVWDTRASLPGGFDAAWNTRLAALPLANFSMRLDYVRWEAAEGRHAILVLAEEDRRRAALVLRSAGREMHCGWPWRWQAALENPETPFAPGLSAGDAAWLFEQAQGAAGARRLRCFLPAAPAGSVAAYAAGATVVQAIGCDDAALLAGMSGSKRRLFKRAVSEGFRVREAGGEEDYVAFHELQRRAERLRHDAASVGSAEPAPGHGFREWDLPWMQLLVALRDDQVIAGVGDGLVAGGVVEGRAAAVSVDTRRLGVMALLCHHEARWLRDRGHRWLNHGGDTPFKREIAGSLGRRLQVHCWLGGGAGWSAVNAAETLARRARPRVAELLRGPQRDRRRKPAVIG